MKWLIYGQSVKDTIELEYVVALLDTAFEYKVELVVYRPYFDEIMKYDPQIKGLKTIESYTDLTGNRPDIMITFGGDGTILQAITLIKDSGIPVLGINLGRLRFFGKC